MSNKKPDQVVDNPGIMPYTTNVGAPAIQKEDIALWKFRGISKVNHQLKTKFDEIKAEYEKLIDEYTWNDLIYGSNYSFEPIIGETYHLYYKENGEYFLSLIGPNEWKKSHIGSFKLDSSNKWVKLV